MGLIAANTRPCRFQARKSRGDSMLRSASGFWEKSSITRSGSWTAIGRRSTVLTMLKIAVFAPMPKLRVNTVSRLNPGFRASRRNA